MEKIIIEFVTTEGHSLPDAVKELETRLNNIRESVEYLKANEAFIKQLNEAQSAPTVQG